MHTETLAQLLGVMEEQVKVMTDLTALSKKKSQVLVDGNMDQLDVLLRGEETLLWHMGRLEERRFKAQAELAVQLGIHPSQLTLERLTTDIAPFAADQCQSLAVRYREMAGELAATNQLNTELVQQAIAYVDFSLQLLGASGPAGSQTYSPKGPRPVPGGRPRRLDNRM